MAPIFSDLNQGTSALVTLLPRTGLSAPYFVARCARTALFRAVLSGAVKITRAGVVAVVRQGEVASFDASSSYELANRSAARATLLLTLPPAALSLSSSSLVAIGASPSFIIPYGTLAIAGK